MKVQFITLITKVIIILSLSFPITAYSAPKTPPPKGEIAILIDVPRHTLTIMADNEPYKQYKVAVGKDDTPSPVGSWRIARKAGNWGDGFGSRFMLLNVTWGMYGIHGTNKPLSIGSRASHGCFRMFDRDIQEIYPWLKDGTPVIVVGNPFGRLSVARSIVHQGHKGANVMEIQRRLKFLGFYSGDVDGRFGYGTEKAVKEMQKAYKLELTGQVSDDDFRALGF
ncbi:MAG: L,D-transpeptidase family protein [Thermincolia bacterium]